MILSRKRKITGKEEALSKAMRYCAYQERCSKDVEKKLYEWGLPEESHQWVIQKLVADKFIDNKRFAMSYARSKLNFNQWGRNKIRAGLNFKGVDKDLVDNAIDLLDETLYRETLKKLALDKAQYTGVESFEQLAKLKRFLL